MPATEITLKVEGREALEETLNAIAEATRDLQNMIATVNELH